MKNRKIKKKKKRLSKRERKRLRPYKPSEWIDGMALRPPGALIAMKMKSNGILSQRIIDILDKHIERGMKTIYSQRSRFVQENFARPQPKPKTMGKEDWKRHRGWLNENALPKKDHSRKQWRKRRRRPLSKLTRYKTLSVPRWIRKKYKRTRSRSSVKRKALRHRASARTRILAKVLERFQRDKFNYDYEIESTVSPNALHAQCSERTRFLAVAKEGPIEPKRKETKYGVSLYALKYESTKRTEELAKPKPIYVPNETEGDELIVIEERELTEYGVSTSALKYKTSSKILELSKPKEPPEEAVPEVPYDDKPRTKYNVAMTALKYKISDRMLKLSQPRER